MRALNGWRGVRTHVIESSANCKQKASHGVTVHTAVWATCPVLHRPPSTEPCTCFYVTSHSSSLHRSQAVVFFSRPFTPRLR